LKWDEAWVRCALQERRRGLFVAAATGAFLRRGGRSMSEWHVVFRDGGRPH
jgi:hypothetical protein